MHTVADFILEAAENSSEAGSSSVCVKAGLEDGIWDVEVADDGEWTLEEGKCSTKGAGRGRALKLLAQRAESWHLEKGNGTVLSFRMADDGSLDDLYPALLPLFLRDGDVEVSLGYGNRSVAVSTSMLKKMNAFPEGASGIRGFRSLLEGIIRR